MNFIEIIRSVLLNIMANKFRVFLTSLGIIIGTFTIIMVVGIGRASEEAVKEQYKKLSVETIMIRKGRNYNGSKMLKLENFKKILELPSVKAVGATLGTQASVSYGTSTQNASVTGVTESYREMVNLDIEYGDFFSDVDGQKRNKVAIVGSAMAELLFEEDVASAVGKQLTIKGRKYQVKGILKRIGDSNQGGFGGGSVDDGVFIPYEVAEKYTAGRRANPAFTAQAKDINSVASAMEEIKGFLTELTENEEAYTVMDAGSRLSTAQATARTLSALLISVATIVLIVGGIGIMNVLFVSVKERTREIGILKSIGARRSDILLEFLFESIFISVIGGVIGILLSIAAMPLMKYTPISAMTSYQGMLLGLVFSVVTGTFFGFYPAYRASKLKPIDALNQE